MCALPSISKAGLLSRDDILDTLWEISKIASEIATGLN